MIPLGSIELSRSNTRRPVGLRVEKIAAYGPSAHTPGSWLALSGRSKLVWVRESFDEVCERIDEATRRLRGEIA